MPDQTSKKQTQDGTRIGEYAATQPVSGVKVVDEAFAANGFGMGNYVHIEKTEIKKAR